MESLQYDYVEHSLPNGYTAQQSSHGEGYTIVAGLAAKLNIERSDSDLEYDDVEHWRHKSYVELEQLTKSCGIESHGDNIRSSIADGYIELEPLTQPSTAQRSASVLLSSSRLLAINMC